MKKYSLNRRKNKKRSTRKNKKGGTPEWTFGITRTLTKKIKPPPKSPKTRKIYPKNVIKPDTLPPFPFTLNQQYRPNVTLKIKPSSETLAEH